MILQDKLGNMFNVEAVLTHEHDPEELRLLGEALHEKVKELKGAIQSNLYDYPDPKPQGIQRLLDLAEE